MALAVFMWDFALAVVADGAGILGSSVVAVRVAPAAQRRTQSPPSRRAPDPNIVQFFPALNASCNENAVIAAAYDCSDKLGTLPYVTSRLGAGSTIVAPTPLASSACALGTHGNRTHQDNALDRTVRLEPASAVASDMSADLVWNLLGGVGRA